MDVLSEVLQQVSLAGAVLFRARVAGPWRLEARSEAEIVADGMPGTAHLILFHVVLAGRMQARLEGPDAVQLEAGEALILPQGDAHVIGDTLQAPVLPPEQLYGDTPAADLRDVRWGDGELHTLALCGYLGCERSAFTPLFASLPPLFKVSLVDPGSDPAADPLLAYAERQAISSGPGADGLRLRMAELMFVEALRRYMQALPETGSGWLAGLRNPVTGCALRLMHESPQRRWTVDELARRSGASRSCLAERFTRVLGEPPMRYLTRWRMLLAARRLRESRDSVAAIAEAVGYESQAAFQRGFVRYMGTTPARWRRGESAAD